VLIIEDDPNFAHILLKQANIKGFKCLTAATGEDGLYWPLNSIHKPLFYMGLPGISGKQVRAKIKYIRKTHIHIISANDRSLSQYAREL
jgi:DNA-binding response OmpR family regulator